MQSVKQELLAALGAELERLSPGAGAHPTFEAPKVAAHGDWASTAALQLAKPLKQNPRQLAQQLCEALRETEAFRRWTSAIEVAGPGFLNITHTHTHTHTHPRKRIKTRPSKAECKTSPSGDGAGCRGKSNTRLCYSGRNLNITMKITPGVSAQGL